MRNSVMPQVERGLRKRTEAEEDSLTIRDIHLSAVGLVLRMLCSYYQS